MKSKVPFLLHLLLCLCFATQAVQAKPVTYLWDYDELLSLRGQPSSATYQQIVAQADNCLKQEPVAVTQKTKCISGDLHNYESLSIYWWPDPQNPGGPYICKDGQYNPEYKEYDYQRLLVLTENLRDVGKAFFLTGSVHYYDYFCRQLDIWFINKDTRMYPDFEYSQFIPGFNGNHGNPGGMTDAYNFITIMESIRLVDSAKNIGRKRRKAMSAWFGTFANWMQTSDLGIAVSHYKNGHCISYDLILYNMLIFSGNKSGCKALQESFFSSRIASQINEEDGRIPEALVRTRAFFYSLHNLQRMLDFCYIAKSEDREIPLPSLALIGKGFHYLMSFQGNRDLFPYQELDDWHTLQQQLAAQYARYQQLLK